LSKGREDGLVKADEGTAAFARYARAHERLFMAEASPAFTFGGGGVRRAGEMDEDDLVEQAIAAKASEDGAFAVAYALLRLAKALNVRPLSVEELDEPIEKVSFSNRARNTLEGIGIKTVRDLTNMSDAELFRRPKAGKETLREIKAVLAGRNLSLR
jgi:hypothetical protein